jgi:hypothetical protein
MANRLLRDQSWQSRQGQYVSDVLGDIVDGAVSESDATFLDLVGELELVKHLELPGSLELSFLSGGKRVLSHIIFGIAGANSGIDGDSG